MRPIRLAFPPRFLADFHRFPHDALRFASVCAAAAKKRCAMRFASRRGWIRWCWASRRILGQMKRYGASRTGGGRTGDLPCTRCSSGTFAVAKEVRSTTDIGASSVSLAAAAVKLAARTLGAVEGRHVLFIGAGEYGRSVVRPILRRSIRPSLTIANRTLERSEALAHKLGGNAMRLSELPQRISGIRFRHFLHGVVTADHRPGHDRARHRGRVMASRCSCSIWRCHAIWKPKSPGWRILRCTPSTISVLKSLLGGENRQAAVIQAEAIIEEPSAVVHAVDRQPFRWCR